MVCPRLERNLPAKAVDCVHRFRMNKFGDMGPYRLSEAVFGYQRPEVVNHIADAEIDARMARTEKRPVATGRVGFLQGLAFSAVLGVTGMAILYFLSIVLSAKRP